MAWKLGEYVQHVMDAVDEGDGGTVARYMRVSDPDNRAWTAQAFRKNPNLNIGSVVDNLRSPWNEIMGAHIRCLQAYQTGNYVDAYSALVLSLQAFLREFRSADTAWGLAVIRMLLRDLRQVADKADEALAAAGKAQEKLNDAGSNMQKVFAAVASNPKKKAGALDVVCQLFKIYFKLNTLHLCKNLITPIEKANFYVFDQWPAAQRVTYWFYTGRLAVFNDDFKRADKQLSSALQLCHKGHTRNMRRILKYLVPVKLSLGQVPRLQLLQQYNLPQYMDLARAVRTGDVRLLDRCLERHQESFLRSGVYLVLERLRSSVYRTLLKKIALIQQQQAGENPHQIKLALVQKALRWCNQDMDLDEVECTLANLIFRGYVKGYLHHKNRILVISKAGPFPKLSMVVQEILK